MNDPSRGRRDPSPRRVCFFVDSLQRRGTELFLLRLLARLDRRRVAPTLALLDGSPSRPGLAPPPGCPTLRLGLDRFRGPRLVAGVVRLAAFLRREQVELLQLHHPLPTAVGILAAWLAGTPRLLRTRFSLGHWVAGRYVRSERIAGRWCDATLVNCAAAGEALREQEGLDPSALRQVENGIDTAPLAALAPVDLARAGGAPVVGFLGALQPVKDPERLVRAAALVASRRPGARFVVAGDGPLRRELEALGRELGLAERLEWRGEIADVAGFFAGIDVFVLSSRSEALPNVLLEAMAAARPVVATAVGGVREAARDGVEALLVPAGDERALADAILRLLADPPLAHRLAAAARARCLERYAIAPTVERLTALYEEMLSTLPVSRLGRLSRMTGGR